MDIRLLGELGDIAKLGQTLSEAKQILARLHQVVVSTSRRPPGSASGLLLLRSCHACHVKDWRLHQMATLIGTVPERLPRFRCAGCGHSETANRWPSYCRSTLELDQLQAHVICSDAVSRRRGATANGIWRFALAASRHRAVAGRCAPP
jgi:hypothetical protein